MRQIITSLIILTICTGKIFSQLGFDDKLLQLEEKIFRSTSDSEKADICLGKIDLYLKNKDYSTQLFLEIKRINYKTLTNYNDRVRYLWNSAIVAKLNHEWNYAAFYYNRYYEITNDTSISSLLLEVLVNNGNDSVIFNQLIKRLEHIDKQFDCVNCLADVLYYEKKHRNAYLLASAILPGMGSALNGYTVKGITSLMINTLSAYAIYAMIQNNLYLNAIFWGSGLALKFYAGNILLTNTLFDKSGSHTKSMLADKCEHAIGLVLSKYPIEFK